ncbi:MAG: hypothetical protein DRP13_02380 [Candidatus Aenigmatarchaeota archaeon]|nr:MAG: hypothetical protein DRP16_04925 [Candidatus Aenigmarchaeota archaeon]RLJ08465.1 MAG: hypothetical protein DRP13_02380 [Candidatus Aenigmarchaeota archaeon]
MRKQLTVLEVSYEVANKYGGIHTVIVSKIKKMQERFSHYYTIGPYYKEKASVVFEEREPPEKLSLVFNKLKEKHGIICRYGKWMVEEKPFCILIDPAKFREKLNDIKFEHWNEYKIDSLGSDWWYDEPLPWSKAAGIFIEELFKSGFIKTQSVAHFHEWLTGAGLLHLKSKNVPIPAVFTTHSTVLGRAIAGTGKEDLYEMINKGLKQGKTVDSKKPYEYNVQAKHFMEKAAALNTDVFTTVSETTKKECKFILGREPEILLPNGLDMKKFPTIEDLSDLHINYREHIKKFVLSYFSPYYNIDAKNMLFYLISGRYEFRNKGIDMFIDALGLLNERLKKTNNKKTIVVFICVPFSVKGRRYDVLENLALFDTLEEKIEKETSRLKGKIIEFFIKGLLPDEKKLFDREFLDEMKRIRLQFMSRRGQTPPVSPFELESENLITQALKRNNLLNRKEDRVKIIYYPEYLSSVDGLLGLNYYNAVIGCHLGVFPSYYEPWGYTPLESAALGLQTITTDLAGFGKFIQSKIKRNECSIMVLKREGKKYNESVKSLENMLFKIYKMNKKQRISNKIQAKRLSELADWDFLIENYVKAYEMGVKKRSNRRPKPVL